METLFSLVPLIVFLPVIGLLAIFLPKMPRVAH